MELHAGTHGNKPRRRRAGAAPHPKQEKKPAAEETLGQRLVELWPAHPPPGLTVGATVVAAAGGGLLAAALLGVGPAAIAGAAGFLAYRTMTHRHTH